MIELMRAMRVSSGTVPALLLLVLLQEKEAVCATMGRDFVAEHVRVAYDAVRILCTKGHAVRYVYSLDLAPVVVATI